MIEKLLKAGMGYTPKKEQLQVLQYLQEGKIAHMKKKELTKLCNKSNFFIDLFYLLEHISFQGVMFLLYYQRDLERPISLCTILFFSMELY